MDFEYYGADAFYFGEYALISDGQYCGFIDSNGKIVVSMDYNRAEMFFSDNFGVVYEKDDDGNEKCALVTGKGKKITINKCIGVKWDVGYKAVSPYVEIPNV